MFRHFQPTGRGDKRTGGRNIDTVAAVTASTDDISKQIIRARERVIKLGNARVVLSRRRRRKKGQRSSLKGGGSVLVVGNRRIPGAFIQQLKNGRWHVMQRVAGKNRYPIDVVKIPMAVPLTTAFKQNIERIRRERLPKELGYALQHQLRMVIKR